MKSDRCACGVTAKAHKGKGRRVMPRIVASKSRKRLEILLLIRELLEGKK